MNGLQPLAPQTTHSLEAFGKPDGEENPMDCNFPELLARDLEVSSSIFVSKNMTAGAPSAVSSIDDEAAAETEPALARSVSPSARFRHGGRLGLAGVRSLDAIEEKPSVPDMGRSGADNKGDECLAYDAISESSSSSHSSSALEPPSIRLRDNSIMTAATSLTSASFGKVSKSSEVHGIGSSWIDADSDMSDSAGRDSSELVVASAVRIGKRRFAVREKSRGEAVSTGPKFVDPFKQHPVRLERGESVKEPRPKSRPASRPASRDGCIEIPQRRSSMSRGSSAHPDAMPPKCPMSPISPPATPTPVEQRTVSEEMVTEEIVRMTKSTQAAQHRADGPALVLGEVGSDDEEPAEPVTQAHEPKSSQASVNVQNWLESSIEPMLSHPGDDNAALGVPLPPDVIESVRVSITCFPETMLLTSSLSIETIRAYSRKLKNPNTDFRMPSSPSSPSTPRKWNISRVLPRRTNSIVSLRGRHHQQQSDSSFDDSASVAPVVASPPWLPLRHIFNYQSGNLDYLCDSLYSHIVAYNYISTLTRALPALPRSPRPNTAQTRVSFGRDSKDDPTEIPRKAAFLLGLNENPTVPEPAQRGRSRLARKRSVGVAALLPSRPSSGTQTAPPAPRQERADLAIRDLQVGLAKCIARLVVTMKKLTGGEAADKAISEGLEIDPLFMRSLCEVVRCSEEMQC